MPTEKRATRKLRAILSADVKGYSILIADDETFTIKTIKEYRSIISNCIEQYAGRVVDSPGDNILAEFASAVDAVQCAVEIQKQLKKENDRLVENKRLEFRIGVNIGDVVQDENRIYGNGVNIASRIEGLADPAGICVSRSAYDQIKNKMGFSFEYMGEHSVKNISEPVRVYKVLMHSNSPSPLVEETLKLPDKPSIAVLPFVNMSGDPEQEYFSDGITEDLTTVLSRNSLMFVIARNSSFAYKGKAVDVKKISKELGVHYVLEGSVRKAGTRIRVTAQLINGINGKHVWAEKYDGELQDIFDLQDQITQKIVASTQTQVALSLGEVRTAARHENLDTWDITAKALKYSYDLTEDSLRKAEKLLRSAIKSNPKSDSAYALLASVLFHLLLMGYEQENVSEILNESFQYSAKAISINESNEIGHWINGNLQLFSRRNHDYALAEYDRLIEINPNNSLAYGSLGAALTFSRKYDQAIKNIELAIRINPMDPSIFFRFSEIALAYLLKGKYNDAIDWSTKCIHKRSSWIAGHFVLIASLVNLNRLDEAKQATKELLNTNPTARASDISMYPFKYAEDVIKLQKALCKAGLPE